MEGIRCQVPAVQGARAVQPGQEAQELAGVWAEDSGVYPTGGVFGGMGRMAADSLRGSLRLRRPRRRSAPPTGRRDAR